MKKLTLGKVADQLGVTRQRAHQIVVQEKQIPYQREEMTHWHFVYQSDLDAYKKTRKPRGRPKNKSHLADSKG